MQQERSIEQTARQLWNIIQQTVPQQPSEADFRQRIDPVIEGFCEQISLATPDIRSEMTLLSSASSATLPAVTSPLH